MQGGSVILLILNEILKCDRVYEQYFEHFSSSSSSCFFFLISGMGILQSEFVTFELGSLSSRMKENNYC